MSVVGKDGVEDTIPCVEHGPEAFAPEKHSAVLATSQALAAILALTLTYQYCIHVYSYGRLLCSYGNRIALAQSLSFSPVIKSPCNVSYHAFLL